MSTLSVLDSKAGLSSAVVELSLTIGSWSCILRGSHKGGDWVARDKGLPLSTPRTPAPQLHDMVYGLVLIGHGDGFMGVIEKPM